ncbi:helix-turn-helix domain-containing protein [Streptomyces sp. SRF1]|uniref:helix-turn-helix domain-containing protein n=1 Tax=Streptomyces sp. SRF1 TaxID=1549642 RepID=UPI0025B1D41C|nr:helix-turn-helix domain-containing protein [Streptomyces sp. SRF1]MDN3059388.1 helix-turn-helix domain-containing protein [Streptomyces sp. SRF1]
MSGVDAAAYVMRLHLPTPAHKLVLLAIATRCDQNYSAFPSRALIAGEALVSEERARTLLRELRRDGYLSARQRYRGNGSKTTNRYFVHGPWDQWGGTDTPFAEISHYHDHDDRYAAIHDGEFIPRPTPKAGVVDNPCSDQGSSVAGAGVASNPSPGSSATPSLGVTPAPSITGQQKPTKRNHLPDVRRTSAGGKSAASTQKAPKTITTGPRKRPPGWDQVAAALPQEVQPTRPGGRLAPTLVRAICTALTGIPGPEPGTYQIPPRTPEQLIARINRRWHQARGPERAADGYTGPDPIRRPVGYVADLLTAHECPDPSCEDGLILNTDRPCTICQARRAEQQQAEQARAAVEDRLTRDAELAAAHEAHETAAAHETHRVREHLAAAGHWGELLDHEVETHMRQWRLRHPDPKDATHAS